MSTDIMAARQLDREEVERFVSELYRIFLSRQADQPGLDHYSGRLLEGAPLEETVEVFATSDEYLQRWHRKVLVELSANRRFEAAAAKSGADTGKEDAFPSVFPSDYDPPGEAGRSYQRRLRSGFLDRYCSGPLVLDVGFSGYDNPEMKTALPGAIGIDVDYPGYDGIHLPFEDGTVDCIFSSHCLEHIQFDHAAIRDWYRVLRLGGFIVCMVPSQALYEKRRFLPSQFNADHKRMYTPSSLARVFEEALDVNSYRVRHLAENDADFDYSLGPDVHSNGAYEIEIVIEKIVQPSWTLA
jgi:hypothetical protein